MASIREIYKGIHVMYKGSNAILSKSIRDSIATIREIYKGIHESYQAIHVIYKEFHGNL